MKVSLKDFPITTKKIADWNKYRRKFVSTLSVNFHQYVIDKAFRLPNNIFSLSRNKYKKLIINWYSVGYNQGCKTEACSRYLTIKGLPGIKEMYFLIFMPNSDSILRKNCGTNVW